jgi:acyl carrier protein
MSEDVSSKVKKIVADHLGIDEAKVNEDSSFIDDLGADSLDTVELGDGFSRKNLDLKYQIVKQRKF